MQEISFRNDILPLKDRLYRLALRIALDRAEAEDIVQDTLIRVWNQRAEWPGIESIEAYCLTVCRRIAIDRTRLKEHQNEALGEEAAQVSDEGNPYETMVTEERVKLLHRLVSQLPEKQRSVMQLRDVEGKSYKEIATILEMSEEQVKVTLLRARQRIKEQFIHIENYGL
jgi:RNA polymerase sigma-70 factor (ECF subfamily)